MLKVKKKVMVKPAEETPRTVLWLSSLDLIHESLPGLSINFYRSTGCTNNHLDFFNANILREALEKVLVPFYPLAGRFSCDDSGRVQLNCNEEGALFVEAETDAVIDDYYAPPCEISKMLVPTIDRSEGLSSFPLLAVQVTYFKGGVVSLGINMNHGVGDGFSHFHFLNSWSEIARGLNLTVLPFLDRTLLQPDYNSHKPVQFNSIEYQRPTNMKASQQNTKEKIKPASFRVTKENINILKGKAKELCKNGDIINYSIFEILAGHMWKCVCIARDTPNDQVTKLFFPVSGRYKSRLQPQLPDGYFGNVIFRGVSTTLVGELKSKPLCYAASFIRETLSRMDNDYLRSTLHCIEHQSDFSALAPGPHLCSSPNFQISSWVAFKTYDTDFSWGQPFSTLPGNSSFEGKSYILRDPANDGSLRVTVSLQPSHMAVFEELFFKEFTPSLRSNI